MDYAEIRMKLSKVNDMFIESLEAIEMRINDRQKELDALFANVMSREKDVIQLEIKMRKEYAEKENALSIKKDEYDQAILGINNAQKDIATIKRELEKKYTEIDDINAGMIADKRQTAISLEIAKKKTEDLNLKLQSLETDFAKLESNRKALADKETLLNQRIAVCNKREEELEAKANELSNLDYNLKVSQKKIIAELKRLQLEN